MKLSIPLEIVGTGSAAPANIVTNSALTQRLDTNDEWIIQRTGIRERRFATEADTTLRLSVAASRDAIAQAGLTPADIDMLIVGTITPEHVLPSTACELQAALGCRWVPAFDVAAACSGFVFGFITAAQYLAGGMARNILVVGAECLSRITDMEDRGTAVLFGDGAGAAVIRPSADPNRGVLAATMGADGQRSQAIWVPGGGSAEPVSQRTLNERLHFMRMKGREIYKFAVTQMEELVRDTLAEAGYGIDDLALLIPHQSNLRIIESAVERLGLPLDRVLINIDRYGNTSAASVPLALHEARSNGRIRAGDLVMMVAFGAGLTWGSVLIRA